MKRIILGIFLLVLISACSAPDHVRKKNYKRTHDKKYLPVLNPKPKYFVTVSGTVDQHLRDSGIKPYFEVMYYTMNTACDVTINWAEGVKNVQYKTIKYFINFGQRHYKFRIPLDKYTGGFCQWAIRQISFSDGSNLKPSSIAYFTPCGKNLLCDGQNIPSKNIKSSTTTSVKCYRNKPKNGRICLKQGKFFPLGDAWLVPRNKNYAYRLNFTMS